MFFPFAPTFQNAGLVVNGRFPAHRITGVQRYAHEIVRRLPIGVQVLTPRLGRGAVGHLWEQTVLPLAYNGRLLWNPNASGPLSYMNQIVTFHDLFPIENPEWYSDSYARWYGIAMRKLAQNALHLIAVSEFTKKRLVELFGRNPDDISVIHNGSHMSGPTDADSVAEAAATLSLPSRRYVLSLSSLEQRKNLRGLLKAWEAIHSQVPEDIWLVLAGPKVSETVYSRQDIPLDLPRVFYTGYVPEDQLAGLYTGASLFVFPSFAEGFGLPLLEAMACGRRTISASTSSMPEVGGEATIYIDPADPEDLPRAMLQCLTSSTVSTDNYAPSLERATHFSWDTAASKTYAIMQTALERNPPMVPVPLESNLA